jgi:hypothetical protein
MAKKNSKKGSASQGTKHYRFNNVQELVDCCNDVAKLNPTRAAYLSIFGCKGIYPETLSIDEIHEKAFTGCRYVYDMYFSETDIEIDSEAAQKLEYTHAATGLYVDVGAYVQGLPECFIEEIYVEEQSNRYVDIVVNLNASGETENKAIVNKLKGVVSIVDRLEKSGVRTSLSIYTACKASYDHLSPYTFLTVVKQYESPINIEQVAYLLGSPISLRYFELLSMHIHAGEETGRYVADLEQEAIMIDDPNIVYIPSMYYDALNKITDYSDLSKTYNLKTN